MAIFTEYLKKILSVSVKKFKINITKHFEMSLYYLLILISIIINIKEKVTI